MGSSRYDRPVNSVFAPDPLSSRQLAPQQQPQPPQLPQAQLPTPTHQPQPQLHHTTQQQQLQQQPQQQTIQPPQQFQQPHHILFEFSPIDARDDFDEKVQLSYTNVKQLIANKTPKECHDIYIEHIAANPQQNTEELTMGLLVAILVDQDGQQSRFYSDIVTFSKDSLNLFSCYLNMIIIEKFHKLRDCSVKHILWITNQLIRANFTSSENVCSNIMRQIAGGDLSVRNLWLVENMLDLLIINRSWILSVASFMGPTAIYTYMRLIYDHIDSPNLKELRQKEVDFVTGLLRENFLYSINIGRDFMRLLHNIVKLPEFEKLWNDIFGNPKLLHQNFQGPLQIMTNRTPRRLVQSRLTFDMERKVNFLATQVKFGSHKRYQDWFHKQFLSSPESLSLRSDIIRYICIIIHPSNEMLCSHIIPRWALMGWLLTTCNTSASSFNSKLTLFYDWLFYGYDPKSDSIMNIEPGILLMHYSRHSHPNVTQSSLDFLCRAPTAFSSKLSEYIKIGIRKSFQQILEKRVLPSIVHLLEFPKDSILRSMIRENFPEFCVPQSPGPSMDNGIQANKSPAPSSSTPPAPFTSGSPQEQNVILKTNDLSNEATEAPVESGIAVWNGSYNGHHSKVEVIYPFMSVKNRVDIDVIVSNFDKPLRSIMEDLRNERYV